MGEPLSATLAGLIGDDRVREINRFARERGDAAAGELIAQLPRESDPVVVSALVGHIGALGSAAHLHDLAPFLSHPNPRVVANAIEAMGRLDPDAARPIVLPWLLSEDHRVRANVLLVLSSQWKDDVLGYLTRMASGAQPASRAAAVWCLAQLDDPEVDEVLAARLMVEQHDEPLDALNKAFSDQREASALGPLVRLAVDCPAREELARELIARVANRCGIKAGEVKEVIARETPPPSFAGSVARGLKRVRRRVGGALLERKAHAQARRGRGPAVRPLAWWTDPGVIAGACGLAVFALVLGGTTRGGGSWVALDEPARPAHVGAPRAEDLKATATGPEMRIEGRLAAVQGPTVVIRQDYTSYAVHLASAPAGLSTGQRVLALARYRGYNRMQGYVELDGTSLKVVQ